MKTLRVLMIAGISAALVLPVGARTQLTGAQIQERSIEAVRLAGTEVVATMLILDGKGRTRERKIAQISKLCDQGMTEKKLIRFLSPADVKGIGFLTFDYRNKDDDKWLYMPALKKIRRIVSSENAKSFMGSEFTYADIIPPTVEDFVYSILGEEEVNGSLCWKIEITPVDDDVADKNGYSKKISFICKDNFVLRKTVYYDLDGEIHKELLVLEIKELDPINHKYRILHMVMENKQNGRRSILKTDQIQFNPNVKDEYFTQRYLIRE